MRNVASVIEKGEELNLHTVQQPLRCIVVVLNQLCSMREVVAKSSNQLLAALGEAIAALTLLSGTPSDALQVFSLVSDTDSVDEGNGEYYYYYSSC